MHSTAAHPEILALALIILVLGVGASPERALAPFDAGVRRIAEIESCIAGRLAELGERLDSRWGSRLDSPKPPLSNPPPAAGAAVSL